MNFDLNEKTIFLALVGSRAYGFATEQSDYDFRGVAIPPLTSYVGLGAKFEQVVDMHGTKTVWSQFPEIKQESDLQVMELSKFAKLASENNPSVIEILFSDQEAIYRKHPVMEKLLDIRDDFLSKKVRFTFGGYAIAQFEKMKLHKRYLENPVTVMPKREDFGLSPEYKVSPDQIGAAEALIKKELDSFMLEQTELSEDLKIQLHFGMRNILRTTWAILNEGLPYPVGPGQKYESTKDAILEALTKKEGFSDGFLELLKKERQFRAAKQNWNNYQSWLKNRNPARAELEKKHGFDCYVEETEFLTKDGFKKFDDISENDLLATLFVDESGRILEHRAEHLGIEYQKFTERFDGTFTGNLYNLYGFHTDVLVTPNHRMLIQPQERRSGKTKPWELCEAANLPDTFNIVRQISPKKKNYQDSKYFDFSKIKIPKLTFLRLMGWYLSDGCMVVYPNGKAKEIRISQIKNGKLYQSMVKFYNKYKGKISCSLYEYNRKPNEFNPKEHIEVVLSIRGDIPEILLKECKSVKEKRIPRWVFDLSRCKMEALLDGLIMGDGTKYRPDNALTYYCSLKDLSNDVNELALMCGFETSLYGPYAYDKVCANIVYNTPMYQIYINKTRIQSRTFVRCRNIKLVPVVNKRIVCFTVPNGTLITRLNGQIGIHGNSKHATHLYRLLRMGMEILTTKQVLVKRPDAQELLAIRNGALKYGDIEAFVEKSLKELDEAAAKSTLPATANHKKIQETVYEMIMEFNHVKK